jgi:hypothetical protein
MNPNQQRIGLVGCVSQKQAVTSRAEDLYTSTLFQGRRRFVTNSCHDWYILSAKHGLVHRSTTIEPYDVALTGQSRSTKRRWAGDVLAQIERDIPNLEKVTFEIHAGADYFNFGLVDGLVRRGARVEIPTQGLRQGEQLQYYKTRDGRPR